MVSHTTRRKEHHGSYGIASAATGSSTSSGSSATPAAPTMQGWGQQRSDETLLTGDTAAKVQAIALEKVPGATVSRVETDADGHAAYEAHLVKSDGSLATVYVDKPELRQRRNALTASRADATRNTAVPVSTIVPPGGRFP